MRQALTGIAELDGGLLDVQIAYGPMLSNTLHVRVLLPRRI